MEIFIIILFTVILAILIVECLVDTADVMRITTTILFIVLAVLVLPIIQKLIPDGSVTIKKSSDSDWEYSEKRMPDTTITQVKILGRDTVYPTTIYKNIRIRP